MPASSASSKHGARLRALREAAGLSQRELARQLDVHYSNISFWEQTGTVPRGEVLPALAGILGVSVDDLLGVTKAKPPKRAAGAPTGRARFVFEAVSKLPARQQQKILEVVEAFVAQHGRGKTA